MTSEIKPWRVTGARRVFETRWFSVREDACEAAPGSGVREYFMLEFRNWASAVAVTADDQLVLVRQYRHGIGRVTLELPSGEVDNGESAMAAAMRELREETGYVAESAVFAGEVSPGPSRNTNIMSTFVMRDVLPGPRTQDDPFELTETVLWPLAQIRDLYRESEFCNSSHAGALAAVLMAEGYL
jgi:8-oxo-dGTP pyrophosphatase MutT (NUDIX family)